MGTLRSNAWGLHDLSGNVWEGTADRYGDCAGDATDRRQLARASGDHLSRAGAITLAELAAITSPELGAISLRERVVITLPGLRHAGRPTTRLRPNQRHEHAPERHLPPRLGLEVDTFAAKGERAGGPSMAEGVGFGRSI